MLNASTEQEMTVYWSKVALPYFEDTLDLLIDMVRNSVYDQEELERELLVVIEEQKMVNDQPSGRVEAQIEELLWPGHPLGRDIAGTGESVSGMTREMVLEHVGRFYSPENVVISVAWQYRARPCGRLGCVDDPGLAPGSRRRPGCPSAEARRAPKFAWSREGRNSHIWP